MHKLVYKCWRWSWVVLLPILVAFIFLAANTTRQYLSVSIDQLGTTYLNNLTLYKTGKMEFQHQMHNLYLDIRRAFGLLPADELTNLQLFISESDIAQLNSNLPASGSRYVPALMEYDGRLRRIKLHYRGDFHYHWAFSKKSLRIKTRKEHPYRSMHRFNLIVPKTAAQFNNYLSYALAKSLGLTVPENELVTVTINGKYQGLYLLAEQLDESTLRNNHLLPGDIYSGDQIYGKKLWYGIYRSLFDHPGLWEKSAVNNHYPDGHNTPLVQLLATLKQPQSNAKQAALEQLLDIEAFARFNVLEVLLNSQHHDTQHNWKIYYDPGTGKFMPLVWDPLGWYYSWLPGGELSTWSADGQPPLFVAASSLMHVLHKNGNFVRTRDAVFKEFFANNHDLAFQKLLEDTRRKLIPVIEKDPAMLTSQLELITAEQAARAMQKVAEVSSKIFSTLRMAHTGSNPGGNYQIKAGHEVSLEFTSHQVVQRLKISLNDSRAAPLSVLVSYRDMDGKHTVDVSHLATSGDDLILNLPLISDFRWVEGSGIYNDFIRLSPGFYRINLKGLPPGVQIESVSASWDNESFHPLTPKPDLQQSSFRLMTRVLPDIQPDEPVYWKGQIQLTSTTRINRKLIIEPGTKILLGPDVSVFLSNQLQIRGTADRPVEITSLNANQKPWGALILEGNRADGSLLHYLHLSGGSGYKNDLREYSGMLSIHRVNNVRLDNCLFKDNHLFDDMLHVVYSSILIDNCRFDEAIHDAVDLDISKLRMTNSLLTGSGNDGVDLMTSIAYLKQNTISHSGDKALSVGERSMLFMNDNLLTSNKTAIEAKDDSVAVILGNQILANQSALRGYMKNWRYEKGGRLIVCRNKLKDNGKALVLDKKSHAWESPPLSLDTHMTEKNRSRITENCDLLPAFGELEPDDGQGTPDFSNYSYIPYLEKLYGMLSAAGY